MKQRSTAFSIIELLVAISLSSVIVLGIVHAYRGVSTYATRARTRMQQLKQASQVCSQLYADLSTAYIPEVVEKTKKESKPGTGVQDLNTTITKSMEQSFLVTPDLQAPSITHDKVAYKPCNTISFVCTNPLTLEPSSKSRPVRVIYELVQDKKNSSENLKPYMLIRKQTVDLGNATGKTEEVLIQKTLAPVRQDIIATNIKSFCCTLQTHEKKEQKDKQEKPAPGQSTSPLVNIDPTKLIAIDTWGKQKPYIDCLPCLVQIHLELYDDNNSQLTHVYTTVIPIAAYTWLQEDQNKPAAPQQITAATTPGKNGTTLVAPQAPQPSGAAQSNPPLGAPHA